MSWMNGTASTGAIAAAMGLVYRLNQMSGYMMFNINGLIRNYATVQDATGTISVGTAAIKDAANATTLPRAAVANCASKTSASITTRPAASSRTSISISARANVSRWSSLPRRQRRSQPALRLFDTRVRIYNRLVRTCRNLPQAPLRAQSAVVSQTDAVAPFHSATKQCLWPTDPPERGR